MPVLSNDCYDLLGVPVDANRRDVAQAWRQRKRELADRLDGRSPGEIEALLSRLDESFRILTDPDRSDRYRRYRSMQQAGRSPTHPEDLLPLGDDDAELEDGNTDLDATDAGLEDSVDTLDEIQPPSFDPDRILTVAAAVVPRQLREEALALVDSDLDETAPGPEAEPARALGAPLGPDPDRSPDGVLDRPDVPPWVRADRSLDDTQPEVPPLPTGQYARPKWGYASAPASAIPQAPPERSPGPLSRVDRPPWIR